MIFGIYKAPIYLMLSAAADAGGDDDGHPLPPPPAAGHGPAAAAVPAAAVPVAPAAAAGHGPAAAAGHGPAAAAAAAAAAVAAGHGIAGGAGGTVLKIDVEIQSLVKKIDQLLGTTVASAGAAPAAAAAPAGAAAAAAAPAGAAAAAAAPATAGVTSAQDQKLDKDEIELLKSLRTFLESMSVGTFNNQSNQNNPNQHQKNRGFFVAIPNIINSHTKIFYPVNEILDSYEVDDYNQRKEALQEFSKNFLNNPEFTQDPQAPSDVAGGAVNPGDDRVDIRIYAGYDDLKKRLEEEQKYLNNYTTAITNSQIEVSHSYNDQDFNIEDYIKHLKVTENQDEQLKFHKVRVNRQSHPAQPQNLPRIGIAKIEDFDYFDRNFKGKKERIFSAPTEDPNGQDAFLEHKKKLAETLGFHQALLNKYKEQENQKQSPTPPMLPAAAAGGGATTQSQDATQAVDLKEFEIKDSDTSIKDVNLKIAKLIEKLNSIPANDNLKRIALEITKESSETKGSSDGVGGSSAATPPQAGTPAVASSTNDNHKDLYKELQELRKIPNTPIADFNISREDQAKNLGKAEEKMRDEAVKKGAGADFFADSFRVSFSRNPSEVESKVSVDVKGKFNQNLDVISICIDKQNNIFRQFKLKSDGSGKPEIESSNYAMRDKDGNYKKIEIEKSSFLGTLKYKFKEDTAQTGAKDNNLLNPVQKRTLEKAIEHEEIKLNINGKKYIFKGKEGISKTNASSNTAGYNILNGEFDKYLEEKQKHLDVKTIKAQPTKASDIFISKKEDKEITADEKIIEEKYKIGTLQKDATTSDIYLIKIDKSSEYKLYQEITKNDSTTELKEYKYSSRDDLRIYSQQEASKDLVKATPRDYGGVNIIMEGFRNLFGRRLGFSSPLTYDNKALESKPSRGIVISGDKSRVDKTEFEFKLQSKDGEIKELKIEFGKDGLFRDSAPKITSLGEKELPSTSIAKARASQGQGQVVSV